MSLTRKELDTVYHSLKSQYRRKERDRDINRGMDELYNALIHYIDFDTHIGKK